MAAALPQRQVLVYDGLQRCPYRAGQVARMPLYRQLRPLSPEEADVRFAQAERRVGRALYRVDCPTCDACKGVRVLVDEFRPSKSQRRVLQRWRELGDRVRIDVGPATWSDEKLRLFNRHKIERGLRDDDDEPTDAMGYVAWLVQSCTRTMEMTYRIDDRLVGVGILDLGRLGASSVYYYFDPDHSKLSPGTFSVLQEIELCRRTARKHYYLGLWVEDCTHLAYKSEFMPHERLERGKWQRYDRAAP